MKTTCIIWLVAAAFIAMHARADSCIGPSSRAATNEQFSVDGRFDRTEKKWSYVFTNLKTGEQRVGALAPIEAHAHLEFFLGRDGASFAVLDEHAGHRLTDRFLLYSSDGKLIASLGFIRRDQRGKGYGKEALRLALVELRKLGEKRALLTVVPDNAPSIRVIEANGGRLENTVSDGETGKQFRRYWIEMDPQQA